MDQEPLNMIPEQLPVFVRKNPIPSGSSARINTLEITHSAMEVEDEDPMSYKLEAAPQFDDDIKDFSELMANQRQLAELKNKFRKIPVEVMNRRHMKLREVGSASSEVD
jgi:hypothetical protein